MCRLIRASSTFKEKLENVQLYVSYLPKKCQVQNPPGANVSLAVEYDRETDMQLYQLLYMHGCDAAHGNPATRSIHYKTA